MPLADELVNAKAVDELLACLTKAAPDQEFAHLRVCGPRLAGLGLRERANLLRDALLADFPGGYWEIDATVRTALPDLTGWMIWPVTEAISASALAEENAFDTALGLLAELTPRLTAEFGIRPLLEGDLDRALPTILAWTKHSDEHVRRLASEGTRPLLPWAKRVAAIVRRPEATIPILDELFRDPSEYVRRSVANHLNDISRNHPALAAATAARWLAADDSTQTRRLVRHSMRTLIKKGNPEALALLGYSPPAGIVLTGPTLSATAVTVGDRLDFSCQVRNTGAAPANLVIDYVVHHRKANGSTTPKVFKLTTRTLTPGAEITLTRSHSFKVITTRVYHPGPHALEIQVNGESFGKAGFELHVP